MMYSRNARACLAAAPALAARALLPKLMHCQLSRISSLTTVTSHCERLTRTPAPCSDILAELEEPAESSEVRLKIKADDFKDVANATISAFKSWVEHGAGDRWQIEEPNYEGVRVKVLDEGGGDAGWALLRASLHDPLIVINAESNNQGGALPMLAALQHYLLRMRTPVSALELLAMLRRAQSCALHGAPEAARLQRPRGSSSQKHRLRPLSCMHVYTTSRPRAHPGGTHARSPSVQHMQRTWLRAGVGEIFRKIRSFMVETEVQTCDPKTGACGNEYVDISPLNQFA
jgi:hypothetical protein